MMEMASSESSAEPEESGEAAAGSDDPVTESAESEESLEEEETEETESQEKGSVSSGDSRGRSGSVSSGDVSEGDVSSGDVSEGDVSSGDAAHPSRDMAKPGSVQVYDSPELSELLQADLETQSLLLESSKRLEDQNEAVISILLIILVVGLLHYIYRFFKIFF